MFTVLAAGLFLFSAAAMETVPMRWLNWEAVQILAVCMLLLGVLYFCIAALQARVRHPEAALFRVVLVLWWFLLIAEGLFPRRDLSEQVYQGKLALTAYGEAITWVLVFVILAVVSISRPQYLRHAFSTPFRWVWYFALMCLVASAYAPRPMLALAWAFKLILTALILQVCLVAMHNLEDLRSFVTATFWGFAVLAILPLVEAFSHPSTAFGWTARWSSDWDDTRLNSIMHPVAVSQWGGLLLLLALLLSGLLKRKWPLLFAVIGAFTMAVGGGKAAIFAGVLCGMLFYLVQGRAKSLVLYGTGLLVLGAVVLTATPVGEHFVYYANSGMPSTLSGRTELWADAMPIIMRHPIIGNGYMSSKFVSEETDIDWDAGHMHNGFLETLHNTGLIGLLLMLAIHGVIVRNIVAVLRLKSSRTVRLMAAGALAVYLNLLLNGMLEALFGGRASSYFMLLLALVAISEVLRQKAVEAVI